MCEALEKIVFQSCPYTFLALKVQLVVLVTAFVMIITVCSVSCSLFYSRCPCALPFVKVGRGTCPPCALKSAPLGRVTKNIHKIEHQIITSCYRWPYCTRNTTWREITVVTGQLAAYNNCWSSAFKAHILANFPSYLKSVHRQNSANYAKTDPSMGLSSQ